MGNDFELGAGAVPSGVRETVVAVAALSAWTIGCSACRLAGGTLALAVWGV
jgi:hypothetical protein